MMAQSMLIMINGPLPTIKTHSSNSLLQLQIQRLVKPRNNPFSQLLPFLPSTARGSIGFTTVALFKAKPKAPVKKEVKPKLKVEDGIFGTSGGIGFTKQNELFVGRVAMIGFAVSITS
ncbi:hypothetical protein QQ045_000907 [Rhodiola kirilowii]